MVHCGRSTTPPRLAAIGQLLPLRPCGQASAVRQLADLPLRRPEGITGLVSMGMLRQKSVEPHPHFPCQPPNSGLGPRDRIGPTGRR